MLAYPQQPVPEGGDLVGKTQISFHEGVRGKILSKVPIAAKGRAVEQGREIPENLYDLDLPEQEEAQKEQEAQKEPGEKEATEEKSEACGEEAGSETLQEAVPKTEE